MESGYIVREHNVDRGCAVVLDNATKREAIALCQRMQRRADSGPNHWGATYVAYRLTGSATAHGRCVEAYRVRSTADLRELRRALRPGLNRPADSTPNRDNGTAGLLADVLSHAEGGAS